MRLKFFAIFCFGVILGWVLRPVVSIPVENPKHHVIVEAEIEQVVTPITKQAFSSQDRTHPDYARALQSSRLFLQQKKYSDVVQLVRSLELSGDTMLNQEIKRVIFLEVANLFGTQQYYLASRLLNDYLAYYFNDYQALIWSGRVQIATGYFTKGIKSLYDAKAYIADHLELNKTEQHIQDAVQQYTGALLKKKAWQDIVEVYQFLITQGSDVPSYYVGLATAQIQLSDWYNAEQTLEIIRHDTRVATEVNNLLAQIEQHQRDLMLSESGIVLKNRNGNYLVNVLLNNEIEITLLIDTGASTTSLTPSVLVQASLSSTTFNRRRTIVNTANGQIEVPVLNVDQLSISDFRVDNLDIIVLPMDNIPGVDGLLGMNYLRHFEFIIDQEKALLYLKKR
ncbi:MAG: clan AA aspartic protease [Gammaproteobacteria bacterium]|nr:clan AA aspartic protease [Gammaproteobacteria bacterium]